MMKFRKEHKKISNNIELVSIHIPKTAGTSFRNVLKSAYSRKSVVRFDIRRGKIEMEKKHASSLSGSVKDQRNVVIKEILMGIAFDSEKHAGFYQAILNLLRNIEPAITEEGR